MDELIKRDFERDNAMLYWIPRSKSNKCTLDTKSFRQNSILVDLNHWALGRGSLVASWLARGACCNLFKKTFIMDDILQDTIALFGEEPQDDGHIHYGRLDLTTAPKVCL